MEQGPDFWCWFDTTQFSYHCVHPIHAKMFSIQMLLHFSQIVQSVCTLVLFINPRRACARVTVLVLSVCLSVCVCVCFPYSGTSRNQAYKQQYQRLQRDTGLKRFVPKLWRRLLTSSSAGVVSGILVPFFRRN